MSNDQGEAGFEILYQIDNGDHVERRKITGPESRLNEELAKLEKNPNVIDYSW